VGQVVLDAALHAANLVAQAVGDVAETRALDLGGILRQHRQRRLEDMRQIAGRRLGPPYRLFAMLEQRVQVADERLHLGGIIAVDSRRTTITHRRQPRPEAVDRRDAAPHLRQAAEHEHQCERAEHHPVLHPQDDRKVLRDQHEEQVRGAEQAERPQHRSDEELALERSRTDHRASPNR
jgi:hypothetical protein